MPWNSLEDSPLIQPYFSSQFLALHWWLIPYHGAQSFHLLHLIETPCILGWPNRNLSFRMRTCWLRWVCNEPTKLLHCWTTSSSSEIVRWLPFGNSYSTRHVEFSSIFLLLQRLKMNCTLHPIWLTTMSPILQDSFFENSFYSRIITSIIFCILSNFCFIIRIWSLYLLPCSNTKSYEYKSYKDKSNETKKKN